MAESVLQIPPIGWDCKMESDRDGLRTAGVELRHLDDILRAPGGGLARGDALGRHRAVLDRLYPNQHRRLSGSQPFPDDAAEHSSSKMFLPLENVLGLTGSMTSADTVTCGGSEYSAAESQDESSTAAVDQPGTLCQSTPAVA